MKTLKFSDIIDKVRLKLDEIGVNESEMMEALEDNSNLDSVIESYIKQAYEYVMTNASLSLLDGNDGSTISLAVSDDLVATVALPDDFMRLINIRLSSWKSSLSNLITEDAPEYRAQSNKWLCGNPECPVVAMVHTKDGRKFELYKASSKDDKLSAFSYIPSLGESSDSVSIPNELAEAFICYIAALTLTTFKDEQANGFISITNSILGIQ
jgi:hypothetical protein